MNLKEELSLVDQVIEGSVQQAIKETTNPIKNIDFNNVIKEEIAPESTEPSATFTGAAPEETEPESTEPSATLEGGNEAGENKSAYSDEDLDEEFTEKDAERNQVYANLYTTMLDTGLITVCQMLTKEESNFCEKKYGLTDRKQEQIAFALAEVLNHEKQKKSPRNALIMLVIGLMLPPLLEAGKKNIALKKEKKKEAALKHIKKTKAAKQRAKDNGNTEPVEVTEMYKQPTIYAVPTEPIEEFTEVQTTRTTSTANGRKKGSRKNPKTKKMEAPIKTDLEYYYYSWGVKELITKRK